jgi:hypothetical protein
MFISLPCIFIFAVVGIFFFNHVFRPKLSVILIIAKLVRSVQQIFFCAGALENGGLSAGKEGRVEVIDFEFLGSINKSKLFVLELKLYTVGFFNI